MEQIVLREITWHVQDNQGIRPSQHGFTKGRSCLTNLISFYDPVTHLVDEGKAVDVVVGQESQWHPGLYQKQCGQCEQGSNYPPVLSTGEAAP